MDPTLGLIGRARLFETTSGLKTNQLIYSAFWGIAMAICRECREQISDFARVCPRCGDKTPLGNDPNRYLMAAIGSVGGFGVLWILFKLVNGALHLPYSK